MSCKDCKDSIISQTPSQIGDSKCNQPCPEEIVCLDIIPSSCVFYSGGNLVCSDINYADTVTEALVKINAKLCSLIPFPQPCQKLSWVNLELNPPYYGDYLDVYYPDLPGNNYQKPQFAINDCTGQIYLRGVFMLPNLETPPILEYAFILPVSARPLTTRIFLQRVFIENPSAPNPMLIQDYMARLIIFPNGQVRVPEINMNFNPTNVLITLDGIVFENN